MLPLGVLGGTFDPVHFGHLRLAQEAWQALGLSAVRWIPAGRPAHRAQPGGTGEQRLTMVRQAIGDHPAFQLDEAEVRTNAPSFTVPTLERLRRELGTTQPLVLLMGADAFLGLSSWHRWQALFELAHIAVATRPGHPLQAETLPPTLAPVFASREGLAADLGRSPAGRIVPFHITPLAISATAIRQALKDGHSPRYLLPDPVLAYIQAQNLYC